MHPQLKNPPIVEAIIGVATFGGITAEDRDRLAAGLPDVYDRQKLLEQKEFKTTLTMIPATGLQAAPVEPTGFRGYIVRSLIGGRTVRFNTDGIVYSQLAPYSNWQDFRSGFREVWTLFSQLSGVDEVGRLGLRFVNQIVQENGQQGDFFHAHPAEIPLSGAVLQEFLFQESYRTVEGSYEIRLVKGMLSGTPGSSKHLLDIDVATTAPFQALEETVLASLDQMRVIKNEVFFNSLTERAMEEFNR